eukprot:TRINITY_DN4326_c0_g1_i2.p1 TRINITY_DN4326_c0_g1~~TRINITY_DN4326_c0_g1_i2.p1  ORF type:complete len:896 (+),score=163.77 TRINITY_DN4326_c0_g1_i2:159-2846(+)
MAKCESVLGSWRIEEVRRSFNGIAQETDSLKDVEFLLLECGGVIWSKVTNPELPIVNCTAFQVFEDRVSWNVFRLIRFSAWRGNIIEFVIENLVTSGTRSMDLTLEGWCTLHCIQIRRLDDENGDFPFNFCEALQENLYSDISIPIQSKSLDVHSFFVSEEIRCKLEHKDEKLVNTVLYYLYNESLPADICPSTASQVADFLEVEQILPGLSQLCRGFSKSVNIRSQFTHIVEDLRAAVNQVLTLFGGRVCSPSGQVESVRNKSVGRSVISQPARLAATIKQTSKNVVFVFLKIVQFCVRYEEVKSNLTPMERSIVANFGKSRLFLLLNQLIELMKALKYASVDLSSQARQDLAIYFVEEVEDIATFFTCLGDEFKNLLESIIEHTAVEREILSTQQDHLSGSPSVAENGGCVSSGGGNASSQAESDKNGGFEKSGGGEKYRPKTIKTLRVAMLTKEILSLKRATDQLGYVFYYLKQERDVFSQQPEQDRIRELARQLEQLVDEIPLLVLTLERTSSRLQDEEMLDDCSFLFEFTSQASSVFTVINFIKQNKDIFQPILEILRHNCYQENIEQCLIDLGLVNNTTSNQENQKHDENNDLESPNSHNSSEVLMDLSRKFYDSPNSKQSKLAALGYELFTTKEGSDMVFELYEDAQPPVQFICNNGTVDSENDEENNTQNPLDNDAKLGAKSKESKDNTSESCESNGEAVTEHIAAHRVIVCARCAWFRRALTSGMKEDRERRIVLRDCSPEVFKIFLQFIYSGLYKLDLNTLPVQILVDLLLVADRYEVPVLVDACEDALCASLQEDNAIPLLVLAEQFNTYRLRREGFKFIAARPDLVTPEVIDELPEHLKQEILGLHSWVRPQAFAKKSATDAEEGLLLDSDQESGEPEFNIFS